MARAHGRERLFELTLTLPSQGPATTARARACLRKLGKAVRGLEWLAVLHAGDQWQRPHFHLLTVAAGDVVRAEIQRKTVAEWRALARRAGFGIVTGAPVRSLGHFVAYLGNGVEAGKARGNLEAGSQCFFASQLAARCTTKFAWLHAGQPFRRWVGKWAEAHGIAEDDVAGMRALLGPKWSQRLWWQFDQSRSVPAHGVNAILVPAFGAAAVPDDQLAEPEDTIPDDGWEQLAAREDPPRWENPVVEFEPRPVCRSRETRGGRAKRGLRRARWTCPRRRQAWGNLAVRHLRPQDCLPGQATAAHRRSNGVGRRDLVDRSEGQHGHARTARAPPPVRAPPRKPIVTS